MHSRLGQPRDTGQYSVAGTDSFRLSCKMMLSSKLKSSPHHNFGGNRQNIEKEMRELWIADEGYTFIQVDQSGAEALIVAHLCKKGKYRSLFENGVKPHVYLTLKLFWKQLVAEGFNEKDILTALATPIPELKKLPFWKSLEKMIKDSDNWADNKRYYHMAKKTIHAGSYGMRGNTFRLQMLKESGGKIVLTAEQADAFLEGFHREFPEIREWHSRTLTLVKQKEELHNLFDFPFKVTSAINESDFKDLIAWVPQSTVACITRQAFIKLQGYIEHEGKNWHLMADTHDSYMCMVPDAEVKEAAAIMKTFIEIELESPTDGTLFRMKSEAQAGKNWAPRKEKQDKDGNIIVLNPEGLQEVAA